MGLDPINKYKQKLPIQPLLITSVNQKDNVMKLQKAQRKQAKIKVALQGPSGSGKTYSALLLANGLCGDWSKVAVIDSENHSADLYSDLGDYNVLSISQPYDPEKYIQAITSCESSGMEVIIIDSVSHEWEGAGGILDIHGSMAGNSFTNWSKVTPRHNAFIQKMLNSPAHIIATVRTKQDYVLTDKNGKMVPEKVGLKGITRDGLDYEFTIVFDIDIKHNAIAAKDRTGLFMDKPPQKISIETGKQVHQWCNNSDNNEAIIKKINQCKTFEDLGMVYQQNQNTYQDLKDYYVNKKQQIESSQSAGVVKL